MVFIPINYKPHTYYVPQHKAFTLLLATLLLIRLLESPGRYHVALCGLKNLIAAALRKMLNCKYCPILKYESVSLFSLCLFLSVCFSPLNDIKLHAT